MTLSLFSIYEGRHSWRSIFATILCERAKKRSLVGYSAYGLIYRKVTRTEALESPSQRWRENERADTEKLRNMSGFIYKKNFIGLENLSG